MPFKKTTEKYYESAEFYFLRQNPAFNTLFPELRLNPEREPVEAKDIEDHFDTDNRSASLAVCQLPSKSTSTSSACQGSTTSPSSFQADY